MFLMCSEDYKTAFSHFNLGVACYNLGEYDEAERVLSLVNYMDPSNAETWAYLALVLLKKDNPPLNAAYQTMNEAIKLGLSSCEVLHEIALTWLDLSCNKQAMEAMEGAIKVKATEVNNSDKVRQCKQLALKVKNRLASSETDLDSFNEVL